MSFLTKITSLMYSINRRTDRKHPRLNNFVINYFIRNYADAVEEPELETTLPVSKEPKHLTPEEIAEIRDICRIELQYRGFLRGKPYFEKFKPEQCSLAYQRSLYGRFGENSCVNPAICFTTKDEIEDIQEYETLASSESIMAIRKRLLTNLEEEKRQYRIREELYEKRLGEVEAHKERIRSRLLGKLKEAEAAKAKRDQLMEEVKRFFGYTIDPKDEKFQLMLEQKEKEQKKLAREIKKKKREEYLMAKLAALESGETDNKDNETQTKNKNDEDDEKNV